MDILARLTPISGIGWSSCYPAGRSLRSPGADRITHLEAAHPSLVSPRTVWRLVDAGQLPTRHPGQPTQAPAPRPPWMYPPTSSCLV